MQAIRQHRRFVRLVFQDQRPIHREYEQGKTTSVQYKDGERNFDWKNTNYMFANFSVDSDEQGKFVQAMMQMMSKMHEGDKK